MQEPNPSVLVTAFEPFGPPGKPKREENASLTVLDAFRAAHPGRCRTAVLPVDPRCEVILARALHLRPAGIIAMGEIGGGEVRADGPPDGELWDITVEPAAWDRPVRVHSEREEGSGRFITSGFAAGLPMVDGMDRATRIGSYWCNRIYWRVLEWSLVHGVPAVFLHVRVGGDRARQRSHLEHVVKHMESLLVGAAG